MVALTQPIPQVSLDHFIILDTGTVDGEQWHTVRVSTQVGTWLMRNYKDHQHKLWSFSGSYLNLFDIHEKLYTILAVTWSSNEQ